MARKQTTLAKLSQPRVHDVLARTRLFTLLDKSARRPVIWLYAQPGAGKTTLLASYLEARKRTGIWYQVDGADADPASFIYHLHLAGESSATGPAHEALPLLTPEYQQDLRGFTRRFFRVLFAQLGPDAVFVLDNFQEAPEESAFHRVFVDAMAEVPEGVNVFVLTRGEPPAGYAALLAANAIAIVDGEQLRLTLAETKAIARKSGVQDDAAIQALQDRSHGWAAGLTLLLTRAQRQNAQRIDDDAESLQHVFSYFAQRVFDDAAPEHRQALMQLAFFPLITVELAERLTGLSDVGRLLGHYYKRHLFTDRRRVAANPAVPAATAHAGHVFQFHALFRAFLQHQARASCSADEIRDIASRAAHLLADAGHWEQAVDLLAEAGDWESYACLMLRHAEGLLEQGRRQTVIDWVTRLPQEKRDRDPWLNYWEGRAQMQAAPDRALTVLEISYRRFAAIDDVAGQLACGAAVVQTLWYARLGWSEIAPWFDRLEPLFGENVRFPSRAVELLSYSALHAALCFCRVAHPAIPDVARRLLGLVDDASIDWNQRLSTATHLMTYLHNAAEHELATQLIGKVDAIVETQTATALNRAYWFIFRAIHDMRQADYAAASQGFQRAEDLARQDGLGHAEFAALHFRVNLDLLFRRADEAAARIARLEVHPARRNPDAEMNFLVVQSLLAQLKGDTQAALGYAERGLDAIRAVGAEYFQAVYRVLLASALADGGQPDRALEIIAASRRITQGGYLEVMEAQLLLEEAYVRLVQGDAAGAEARLAQGLGLAARDRARAAYTQRIAVRKPLLLLTALRAGIEVDFVRRLILKWRLPPPVQEVAQWPWPVKVRTFGGFEILVNEAPIEFGRKAPKKTLALLKAIIARGGSAPESALIDIFWPDETGDAAARSLAATVHRLRTLLGEPDAIAQQGRRLSLDRDLVWVDAWAFERMLVAARESADNDGAAADAALALYKGAFLIEEEGETWPVPMRERLRSKFIQTVGEHGARLEAAGHHERAIAWYLRGLDADNVVEPFYQGLMRCYHRLDRLPEAASAYRRLRQALSVTLGMPPSAGTEKLYQALRLS